MRVAMARAQSFLDEIAVACRIWMTRSCAGRRSSSRGYPEIADLVVAPRALVGREMLSDPPSGWRIVS